MTKNKSELFKSKILLFGEYSVIRDSMALSVPYDLFSGELLFPTSSSQNVKRNDSCRELEVFKSYLEQLDVDLNIDLTSLDFDISQGLFFDSTIPQGYGLGSSGALCAAIYDRYGEKRKDWQHQKNPDKFVTMREVFSKMESHFHGASSGIDPLISYADGAILSKDRENIYQVTVPEYKEGPGAMFLIDTGRPRRTEPLVNIFLEKLKNDDFELWIYENLIPITNAAINAFLNADRDTLIKNIGILSQYQLDHFGPMIPKLYIPLWTEGLKSQKLFMKLCGAGGGGFLMGIAPDFSLIKDLFKDYKIRVLYRF